MGALERGSEANHKKRGEQSAEMVRDIDEARGLIHEQYERGERPVVSVPEQYMGALEKGLVARTTWISGFSAIVGTFGRNPYLPSGEKRILIKAELDEEQIEPRFTGPSHTYQGVVVLKGPIPPEKLLRLH